MVDRRQRAGQLALSRLKWLLDAPLFIDEALITRLFDAVVLPEYDVQSRVVGELSQEAHKRLTGGEAGAKFTLGVPFFGNVGIGAKAKHERDRTTTIGATSQLTEHRVHTAGRQLEEIAGVYLDSHPERIVFIDTQGTALTFAGRQLDLAKLRDAASDTPRMLAFFDVAPDSKIIPMACELQTGETELLFERYIDRLWAEADDAKPTAPKEAAGWPAYWLALASRFNSTIAMEIVERAARSGTEGHGRLGWIAVRVPIGTKGDTVHLHLTPDGKYYAGTFGYDLIRRGANYGVRIVGTLKAGLSLNVLAVFDK